MNMAFSELKHSILEAEICSQQVKSWKKQGGKIVFTNGCFDILHKGHIYLLQQAKSYGTHLVVGLNADVSVKALKGEERPFADEVSRAIVLAAIACVDAVVLFAEETPLRLIETLSPDVLVKGGDYNKEEVVGGQQVQEKGGEVVIISYIEGYSTTQVIKKIAKNKRV